MSTTDETVTVRTAGPSPPATADGVDPEPDVDRDRYVGLGADAIELPGASARTSTTDSQPEDGMALALSGGGSRAMLFHAGAIWRLNELGLLPELERISGVSGGAITAGILARSWPELDFGADGEAARLGSTFITTVRRLASKTIDRRVALEGWLLPGSTAKALARAFARELFGDATLQSLPERPRFVFNASNLQSRALFRFSRPYAGDYRIGRIHEPRTPIAEAVAASSAFPPFFAPLELDLRGQAFAPDRGNDLHRPPYTTKVRLVDGGVYDNLGLETVFKRYRTLLVSDGGGATRPEPSPHHDWPRQAIRVMQLIDSQVRSLRYRMLIDAYRGGDRDGAYWGIRTDIAQSPAPDLLPCPFEATQALAAVPTRLKAVPADLQERLMNWGYAAADATVRSYFMTDAAPPDTFPYERGV